MAPTVIQTSELMTAIRANNLDGVLSAIAQGAEIEEADMHGHPGLPLRTACFAGQYDIVQALLDYGADIHAPNGEGNDAPLRLAERARHHEIASLLRERGGKALRDEIPPASQPACLPDTPLEPSPVSDDNGMTETIQTYDGTPLEFTSTEINEELRNQLRSGGCDFVFGEDEPAAELAVPAISPLPAALPDIGDYPPASETFFDLPDPDHMEEINMSVPYGVDTELLSRDLSRLIEGDAPPPGGKSRR